MATTKKRLGITISFGIQKGGSGKTTTAGIICYLLSKKYKVLACDFDSQGNLTSLLTQKNIYDFTERTVLQALQEQNAKKYIHKIDDNPNLDILTAEDFLARLPHYMYIDYRAMYPDKFNAGRHFYLLKDMLEEVKYDYDFIIIDLPPSPGEETHLGLVASDYAIVVLQTEPFCYDALDRYFEIMMGIQEKRNPNLKIAGIVISMLDPRSKIENKIIEAAKETYGDWLFNTIITRKNKIKEFAHLGISDKYSEERTALKPFQNLVKEITAYVTGKGKSASK